MGRDTGNDFDLLPAPGPEDFTASTNSYLEVLLTATDPETGLSATTNRIIMPNMVNLTFSSQPSGLELLLDGNKVQTPTTIVSWTNHTIFVQAFDQKNYQFLGWNNGEDFQYTLQVPSEEAEYIASFQDLCINQTDDQQESIEVRPGQAYNGNEFYCLDESHKFGIDGAGTFGYFWDSELIWSPQNTKEAKADKWMFKDGAIVVMASTNYIIWSSDWEGSPHNDTVGAILTLSKDSIKIRDINTTIWAVNSDQFLMNDESLTLNCLNPISGMWMVPTGDQYEWGDVFCLRYRYKFGLDYSGRFGYFVGSQHIWSPTSETVHKFIFQRDGNLVAYDESGKSVWSSMRGGTYNDALGSELTVTMDGLIVEKDGSILWEKFVHPEFLVPSCIVESNSTNNPILVPIQQTYERGEMLCIENGTYSFGIHPTGQFGYFHGTLLMWQPDNIEKNLIPDVWMFQEDGNIVVRSGRGDVVWASQWKKAHGPSFNSTFTISKEALTIAKNETILWEVIVNPDATNTREATGNCIDNGFSLTDSVIVVPIDRIFERGDFYCLRVSVGDGNDDNATSFYKFGMDEEGTFGYFKNSQLIWEPSNDIADTPADRWTFQGDGNLVVRSETDEAVWASSWSSSLIDGTTNTTGAVLLMSTNGLTIEKNGTVFWELDIDDVLSDVNGDG